MVRPMRCSIAASVLLFLVLLVALNGSNGATPATDDSLATASFADWIPHCRSLGFDVEQLACSTCDVLLPTMFRDECRQCCQAWWDTPHRSQPYQAAILIDRASGNDELKQFVDQDWSGVVTTKGEARLRRVEHVPSLTPRSFVTSYAPSMILFFHHVSDATSKSIDVLTNKAAETVSLDGMKRDDIKNMLLALLP